MRQLLLIILPFIVFELRQEGQLLSVKRVLRVWKYAHEIRARAAFGRPKGGQGGELQVLYEGRKEGVRL